MAGATVTTHGEKLEYGMGSSYNTKITVGGVSLYPTSATISREGETKVYKGANGQVMGLVIPETFDSVSIEGLLPSGGKIGSIKVGDKVTLTGVNGAPTTTLWLETISSQWSNEDATKVTITAKGYQNINS